MILLELDSVTHIYRPGGAPALHELSLKVRRGERLALLGPSGAGKSTLLRCLNGLVVPTSGRVRYQGHSVSHARGSELRALRRSMAVIFQSFNLIESYTALGNALIGCLGRYPFWQTALGAFPPAEVQKAREALDRVGLQGYAGKPVRELSGGQRQRVAIARALVQGAELLLGDEPVASLDPGSARSIMELLLELNRESGITLILSLHDPNLALAFCDRVVAIREGRVFLDCPSSELSAEMIRLIYSVEESRVEPGRV